MERLTERIDDVPDGESGVWVKNHDYILAAEKLADYEDLEEQGRLLKLPCKVGDTIYAVGEIVKEYKVISVGYPSNKATNRSEFCIETLPVNGSRVVAAFYDKEFGKNVFLTKSEAEEKLKELRGNNE